MSNTVAKLNIHLGASTGALQKDFQHAEGIVNGFGKSFGGLGLMAGGAAVAGFLGWGVKLAAEAETAGVAFEVMLGSAERAKKMLGEIKSFAASTPFGQADLQGAARTLLAFGIQGEQIIPTLRMLGDVSGGNAEKLASLATVFGQIASAGKLTGGDLLQLINVGFNPLQVIAAKTGRSMSDLKDAMSKGQITFAMVEEAFKSATSEGGLFFGMMEKQSKTLAGRFSTLQDSVAALALKFGEVLLPVVGKLVDTGSSLLEFMSLFDAQTILISGSIIAFGVAFIGVIAVLPKVVAGFRLLIVAYKALTSAQAINAAFSGPKGWAILAAGAIIAAGAVWGVANAFENVEKTATTAQKKMAAAATGTGEAAKKAAEKAHVAWSDFGKNLESFAAKGKSVTEQLQTPLESYVDRMLELQQLIDKGAVSWETYRRGVIAAGKDLADATEAKKAFEAPNVRVGAVTRFSTAGFSAIEDAKDSSEKLRAIAVQQLEEQKRQTALQVQANRMLEQQGFRPTVVAIP